MNNKLVNYKKKHRFEYYIFYRKKNKKKRIGVCCYSQKRIRESGSAISGSGSASK